MSENNPPIIEISMLGGFQLKIDDVIIDESYNRAHKLWNLLQYLITYRNRDISNEELIGFLWPEDESDNPLSALKNLVYRLRSVISDANIPFAKSLIVHKRGIYSWNNEFKTNVDTDKLEQLIKKSNNASLSLNDKISCLSEAVSLYKGDFLPSSSYETWVIPLTSYYRNLYINAVKKLCDLLLEVNDFETIFKICEFALTIDKFDEELHMTVLNTLIIQNKQQQAINYYNYVSKLFYDELGVKLSEKFSDCYRSIIKGATNIETDLDIVKEGLAESQDQCGAFLCEYEVFKNFYRLESRSAIRTGRALFVGMLTIADPDGNAPKKDDLSPAMNLLLDVIKSSLRNSDIVSRFSATQYIMLLPTHTYENGQMVLNRIVNSFNQKNKKINVVVNIKLQPIDHAL